MSFKLGTFNTDDIEGFKAILTEWPMLPVELSLDELAGDGALFYRARMTETEWVFNLELTGSDVADVMAKADQVSTALNPKLHALQDFTPNPAGDEWVWQGVLAGPIAWERDKVLWFSDRGVSRLAGQATISTPNPYGYAAGDPVVLSGPGLLSLVGQGNTTFYPTVEFRGVLSASQRFVAGGVQVAGPLAADQTLVMDFEGLDFYIKNTATGAKVRNVADRLSNFARLEGLGSLGVAVSVTAGTFTQAVGRVRSRRI